MAEPAQPRPRTRNPQVFINFRGAELRNNFIRTLFHSLRSEGINVFEDMEERRGRNLQILFERIEESRIALAVFSKRYTESKWCLDELVKMHDRANERNLVVIPVFFEVSTSDVKNLEGEFGNHFEEMRNRYSREPEMVQRWENSIKAIAQKTGLPSELYGTGFGLIRKIVKAVKIELSMSTEIVIGDVDVFLMVTMANLLFTAWTDVKFFKNFKWLFCFPVLVVVLRRWLWKNKNRRTPNTT